MRIPKRGVPLSNQVSAEILRLIQQGEWKLGDRIPGEMELAEMLGVSRSTVRESLRSLIGIGLLEARVGDGTYVRAQDEIGGMLMRDEDFSLTDALNTRAGLEAACAKLAATQRDESDLALMSDALDRRFVAHDELDIQAYTTADTDFHHAVINASHNLILIRLHSAVAHVMDSSITKTVVLPENPDVGRLHRQLFSAIQEQDAMLANATAYHMIAAVKQGFTE